MKKSKLKYNANTDRIVLDGYEFHCGDQLEVLINDTWIKTRIEAEADFSTGSYRPKWYLIGLKGIEIEGLFARIK